MIAPRACVVLAVLASPGLARAFSDPVLFSAPVIEGGGAGRYFTGSRTDGYSCNACHGDAPTDDFTIDGLPDRPVAGQAYSFTVRWTDPDAPHSLHLELTTPSGAHPTVTVPAPANLPPESRCGRLATGLPAVYTIDAGTRRIIGVEPCGAGQVTVSFVGTADPIELSMGAVLGNRSDTTAGDATFTYRVTLGAAPSDSSGGGCDAGGGGAGVLVVLGLLAATARCRTSR